MRELVLNKADVNVAVADGNTPIFYAANMGDEPAFVDLLLNAGARVLIQDKDGNSPLDCARAKNYKNVVNLLVKAENQEKMGRKI